MFWRIVVIFSAASVECAVPAHGIQRALHILDGLARFAMDAFDHAGDLHRGLARALGELAHFIGHHGGAPLFAGAPLRSRR